MKEFEEAFVLLSLADAQNASSGKDLLPIYQARLVQVQVALIICTLILAALAAFVQYIYFVLPWYLAARWGANIFQVFQYYRRTNYVQNRYFGQGPHRSRRLDAYRI